ncbi:MAG: squalene/phytoene synthase family protein [Spirochaetales bacterium]
MGNKSAGTAPAIRSRDPATEGRRVLDLLRATSRTFALSIEGLPSPLEDEVAVAYLLFRVSDYLEDHETLATSDKVRLLELWAAVLEGSEQLHSFVAELEHVNHRPGDPEARAALACDTLVTRLRSFDPAVGAAIRERVVATTRGMAEWQTRGPTVETEADLDDYMHHVAGVVGYLVTDLFALHHESVAERRHRLMPLAREFGLALQTVNILRGLRKDFERGWVFVPRTFCRAYGLAPRDLFRRTDQGRAMHVVSDLIAKAERHLRAGVEYVRLLPRRLHRLRLACMWPLLFAARTIGVSRGDPRVLHDEVKISRSTVKQIVGLTHVLGWSNGWLARYADYLLTAPAPAG